VRIKNQHFYDACLGKRATWKIWNLMGNTSNIEPREVGYEDGRWRYGSWYWWQFIEPVELVQLYFTDINLKPLKFSLYFS
jgi:hypothetical protein